MEANYYARLNGINIRKLNAQTLRAAKIEAWQDYRDAMIDGATMELTVDYPSQYGGRTIPEVVARRPKNCAHWINY